MLPDRANVCLSRPHALRLRALCGGRRYGAMSVPRTYHFTRAYEGSLRRHVGESVRSGRSQDGVFPPATHQLQRLTPQSGIQRM